MKILMVNKFFYLKGGAEVSFFETAKVLKEHGHKIVFFSMKHPRNFNTEYENYFVSNIDYENRNLLKNIRSALNILYSFEAKSNIERLLKKEKPDIAHLNNIYHQISPSILYPLKKAGIPIVMFLRDYKMVCPSYSMFNKGKVCELCKDARFYNCFFQVCVKDSRIKSLINTVEMCLHHKFLRIYDLVNLFVSPSRFLIDKFKEMGFTKKIVYLPNFVNLDEFKPQFKWADNSVVYFGRLSREKGLFTLLDAVKDLKVNLKIIGDGPLEEHLRRKVKEERINNVRFLGFRSADQLKKEIRKSSFTVLASEWYENNPRSIIESFALGKPAIGARIGGIPELVRDNQTGLTFEAGNTEDLRRKLMQLLGTPEQIVEMGKRARRLVEEEFEQKKHYQSLMKIYESRKR